MFTSTYIRIDIILFPKAENWEILSKRMNSKPVNRSHTAPHTTRASQLLYLQEDKELNSRLDSHTKTWSLRLQGIFISISPLQEYKKEC